jgi:ParB family transcriptional regulator, chromosome partitioning protein
MSKVEAPRLGRGLAALMGTAGPTATLADAPPIELPVAVLQPGPFQPRAPISDSELAPLVESIRAQGILQPLLVRPHLQRHGEYQIIAGERRWRAAQLANLATVPVHVRCLSDEQAAGAALVENLQRQDLNPLEEAEGYRQLMAKFGWTHEIIAQRVGKSRSHVANICRLLNLPQQVQTEVRNGALSAGHARALLAHPDPTRAALQVIAGGLNVRQTEDLAHRSAERRARKEAGGDPDTRALEHQLSERIGLRVQIVRGETGGQVRITYKSLDQLDGLVVLLSR